MSVMRPRLLLWLALLLALFLASCGRPSAEPGVVTASAPAESHLPSATPLPEPTALPSATALPSDTTFLSPLPTAEPAQLVVLHTNDNWGETEPCG